MVTGLFWGLCLATTPTLWGKDLTYTAGLRSGIAVSPVWGHGFELGVHFDSFAIGLSHVAGTYDMTQILTTPDAETEIVTAIASASMSLLECRYYPFWGLNATVGLGKRGMALTYEVKDSRSDGRLAGRLAAETWVVSHTIGWEWDFDWWYLAIDGVGHAYPIQTSASATVAASGTITGDLGAVNQELAGAAKGMGHVITKQLFLVSLGLAL